jgi:hypothetical protein
VDPPHDQGEPGGKATIERNHECGRWMRKLTAIAIIDGNKSQGFGERSNRRRATPQDAAELSLSVPTCACFIWAASAAISFGSKSVPARCPLCASASDAIEMMGPHNGSQV